MSSMFTWVDFAEDAAAKTGGLPDSRNLNQGTGQVRRKHNSSLSQDRIPLPGDLSLRGWSGYRRL